MRRSSMRRPRPRTPRRGRDPEMHQTKKGNQWYLGMKARLGVDSRSKPIRAAVATPANVADGTVLPLLLHGNEIRVWGDQAYRGQRAVIRQHAPRARDFAHRRYRFCGVVDAVERAKNRTKSKMRAKVEHPIGIIKRVFRFANVRYRGLKRTLIASSSLAHWPICSPRGGISCAAKGHRMPALPNPSQRPPNAAQSAPRCPTQSLAGAMPTRFSARQRLVQT